MPDKLEVMAASGYETGYVLTTRSNAKRETPNEEYEADAQKVIDFLHTLPGGTVDKVFRELKKTCS